MCEGVQRCPASHVSCFFSAGWLNILRSHPSFVVNSGLGWGFPNFAAEIVSRHLRIGTDYLAVFVAMKNCVAIHGTISEQNHERAKATTVGCVPQLEQLQNHNHR